MRFLWRLLIPLTFLAACEEPAEQNSSKIAGELAILQQSYSRTSIDEIWDYADLLTHISQETLSYLSENQNHPLRTNYSLPYADQLRLTKHGLKLMNPASYQGRAPDLPFTAQAKLKTAWDEIQADDKIVTYVLSDSRHRIGYKCVQICGCIVNRLGLLIKAEIPEIKVLDVMVQSDFGINIRRGNLQHSEFYDYHRAIFVRNNDTWGIIDPFIYGDSTPHDYSDWRSRLIPTGQLRIRLMPFR